MIQEVPILTLLKVVILFYNYWQMKFLKSIRPLDLSIVIMGIFGSSHGILCLVGVMFCSTFTSGSLISFAGKRKNDGGHFP